VGELAKPSLNKSTPRTQAWNLRIERKEKEKEKKRERERDGPLYDFNTVATSLRYYNWLARISTKFGECDIRKGY